MRGVVVWPDLATHTEREREREREMERWVLVNLRFCNSTHGMPLFFKEFKIATKIL